MLMRAVFDTHITIHMRAIKLSDTNITITHFQSPSLINYTKNDNNTNNTRANNKNRSEHISRPSY